MVLTPTYHVFEMYTPFMEATYLPVDLPTEVMAVNKAYFKEKEAPSSGERSSAASQPDASSLWYSASW